MADGTEISRRHLLATAALPLAVAGTAQAAMPAEQGWDKTVDVVVIGSGTGLCAALVAISAGLKVLVLEKSELVGGTTVVSGGVLWVPNNRVMQSVGLKDSREEALTYLRQLAHAQAAPELLEAFVDNGADMLDFVQANTDIRWTLYYGKDSAKFPNDYHPSWQGSHPGRSVCTDPRVPGQGENTGGPTLIAALQATVEAKGGEVMTETPAVRLIMRETHAGGEVIGVEAQRAGKPWRIQATRGVLVAAGGFERNREMKQHFLRGPSPYTLGAETNTGDGIRMGMAVGADLRNMNELWGITVYKAEGDANGAVRRGISLAAQHDMGRAGSICVNRYGERFLNESADYDASWRSYHSWENWLETGYRNMPAYIVCDHACREAYGMAGVERDGELPEWVTVAGSLDELAAKLKIDPAGLAATVFEYNRNAALGRDPDFHRGESRFDTFGGQRKVFAPLLTPPFYGAEVSPGDLGTCGGLRVDGNARVQDVFGRPIGRLYASGNSSGVGGPGALYGGFGGTLGPAMTFAYIAGRSLSAEPPANG